MRTRLVFVPVVLLAGLGLTACGSATTGGSTAPQPSASSSAMPGGDAATWTPQVINAGETTTVTKGQYLVLGDLPEIQTEQNIDVVTSDRDIVKNVQSGPDAYAMEQAVGVGEVTVNVYIGSDSDASAVPSGEPVATYTIIVEGDAPIADGIDRTFNDSAMPGYDPAAWSPAKITQDTKTIDLTTRQYALIDTAPIPYDDSIVIKSSDSLVVGVIEQGPENFGLVQAGQPGKATLEISDTDGAGKFMTVQVTVNGLPENP